MRASIDDLFNAARIYDEGSVRLHEIIIDVNKSMKTLEESWSDANQQSFFEYHKELNQHLLGCTEIMTAIAKDINEIAKKYETADADKIPQLSEKGENNG